jgi:hypothetical protein
MAQTHRAQKACLSSHGSYGAQIICLLAGKQLRKAASLVNTLKSQDSKHMTPRGPFSIHVSNVEKRTYY